MTYADILHLIGHIGTGLICLAFGFYLGRE